MVLIALLAAAVPPAISAQQIPKRTIELSPYGLVYVYDEVPSIGEKTVLEFPKNLVKNLVNYVSPNDPEPEMKVGNETFSIIVHSKPGETIRLTTVFRDVVLWSPYDQVFQLRMPIYPLVSGAGEKVFSLTVKLPSDSSISNVSPENLNQTKGGTLSATFEKTDLSGRDFKYFTVVFSSRFLKIIDITSAKMIIDPFSREADLALSLRSLGGKEVNKITFNLPAGSEILKTSDSVGEVSNGYDPERGELTVNLRQPIGAGQRVYVEVSFKFPEGASVMEIEDGRLTVSPILPMNATAWTYDIELILRSVSPVSWSPEPYEVRREYPETSIMTYKFTHLDPLNVKDAAVTVKFERTFSAFSILPYALVIAIFAIGSVAALYIKKPERKAAEEKPTRDLTDEAQGLISAYQTVVDLIRSGKIFEKGRARSTILEARAEARRSAERLRRAGRDVRKTSPEMSSELERLERSAGKLERALERAWDLAYPYFSGSLSKKRFRARLDEYYEELKKAYGEFADSLEEFRKKIL